MSRYYDRWPKYVPVAERRAKAAKLAQKRQKAGEVLTPVIIQGRKIADTFWGKAWCENLESYSDYENRLPRGRSYVRNGSVIDLKVTTGKISALVSGSSIYKVEIIVTPMSKEKWDQLVSTCSGKIDSVIELLQGKFSKAVMELMTESKQGLFPKPKEIKLNCSCPDWADMCKHVAATLYGVGASLDHQPDWLFLLRQVDHMDLIVSASVGDALTRTGEAEVSLADEDLSAIFGIEMDAPVKLKKSSPKKAKAKKTIAKKALTKKAVVNKKTSVKKLTKKAKKSS